MRGFFVFLHRWAGLAMAAFLVVVGLTGSLLAFNTELERVFAPQLFATPRIDAPPLGLAALASRAEAQVPQGRVISVTYAEPDQVSISFAPRQNPQTQAPYDLGFTEFFVDPWTGAELGRRRRADLSEGLVNLMPFIYDLHWRLMLGVAGQLILGIVATIWTLDCFVAFYLTFPPTTKSFVRRWKPAWLVKRNAGFYRLNFDLHRAGGLWLWAALFVFAWSSVMMNLRPFVYEPVMRSLFDFHSSLDLYLALPKRAYRPPMLDWRAAQETGERLIAEQSAIRGFAIGKALALSYLEEANAYIYEVRGGRDLFERSPKGGGTYVMLDGDDGHLIEASEPTGEHVGNTIESWLYALHMARIFGLPYRLFVCALGLALTALSATGVYIWWKKRGARRFHARRDSAEAPKSAALRSSE
ncbi:PepSY-associated TM helix domain-containing protein [Methylosinus sp. LW4]|uniref:PepSY-associated TM helix domain-containing protein n=1 Tax=Methylosinus sp. LW4 TaxID=136993 RepID=UPI0003763A34|nr:PepSY-associated TM helix domain-containing protein [Methylosinus sp. LW4]